MTIGSSLLRLRNEVAHACHQAGRDPSEITLVAVSKTHPAAAVREAYAAGIRVFGENRAQELLDKRPQLADLDLEWHFIGGLQTNKAKRVVAAADLIHSVDRIELARAIDQHAAGAPEGAPLPEMPTGDEPRSSGRVVPVLLQVNTTGEATKSGVAPDRFEALFDAVRRLRGISVRGLMTIGPLGGTEAENRHAFARLRELRDSAASRLGGGTLPILSMGMSDDFHEAILEGATHLRIGSLLFGEREYPPRP